MPVEEPQFGEVWTTTDMASGRLMQGIIADVSPTRALFVSLAGNRVAVPLSRLRTNWNFVQGAPKRTLPPCERTGCTAGGMIEYDRDRVIRTCPRHAPFGVQCRITANYIAPIEPRTTRPGFECRSTPCPTCGDRDPAEDVRIAIFPARLWFCTSCNARWVTVPRIPEDEQNIEQIALTIAHELGRLFYEVDSIFVLHQETWNDMRRSATAHMEQSAVEAIPRLVIGNMQASMETGAVIEQVREHFHAIARVRANVTRPVDRPVQRLGGSPNRGGVVGSTQNPVRPTPGPDPLLYRPTGTPEAVAQAEAMHRLRREDQQQRAQGEAIWEATNASTEAAVADVLIERESVWIQRASGDLMVVLDLLEAQDGSEAISFRRSAAEDIEPAVTMTRRDFLLHHRAFVTAAEEEARPSKPSVEISIDEEWECQDGSGMIVTQVDFRREFVYGDDLKTKRRRQIPFTQFIAGRWRKIVRRSIYDRLRKPEISLNSSGSDED